MEELTSNMTIAVMMVERPRLCRFCRRTRTGAGGCLLDFTGYNYLAQDFSLFF